MNGSCAHVQRSITSTWQQDTCQIRLLLNRLLNRRWNSAGLNNIMIADAWSEGLVADEYSNGGGQSWSQCPRCWRVSPKIQKQWCGLQKAAVCALTLHHSHAGIDFNIPLQRPSIKHGLALLSTLLKLRCCHTSQWWASDIQPVAPCVPTCSKIRERRFRIVETTPYCF